MTPDGKSYGNFNFLARLDRDDMLVLLPIPGYRNSNKKHPIL